MRKSDTDSEQSVAVDIVETDARLDKGVSETAGQDLRSLVQRTPEAAARQARLEKNLRHRQAGVFAASNLAFFVSV